MYDTIVVPLDGSELAEEALERASDLASRLRSRVVLVQAIDSLAQRMSQPGAMLESPAVAAVNVEVLQEALDAEKHEAQKYLAEKRNALVKRGIEAEAYVGEGQAAEVILKLAADKASDMVVMSTHGRGGLGRLVFGSVADAVLRHSEIPVLLIRSKPQEKD